MNWFRLNRRSTGWLALFALAFQLAVSFGHVHVLADSSQGAVVRAPAHGGSSGGAADPRKAPGSPDVCAICAVMALAASTLVPTAPQLAVLLTEVRVDFRPVVRVALSAAAHAAFRARAPPV